MVIVTHDRYFLDNVTGWVLELDRGHGIPWEGNYSSWLEQKQKTLDEEKKQDQSRLKTLERELEWVRMAPKARQTKNKARLSRYDELVAQDRELRQGTAQISLPPGPRLGEVVVEASGLRKAYGEKLLFDLALVYTGAEFRIQADRAQAEGGKLAKQVRSLHQLPLPKSVLRKQERKKEKKKRGAPATPARGS